jgi:hypothetical protein
VIPLLVLVVGLALLVGGWLVLRSFGPRLRVGRLIAATPHATVAEALALAESGARRYVAVRGRVDSEREFEDADHRPLVIRRTRFQARNGRGWRTWEDNKEVVPFEIRDGLVGIGVNGEALDHGLVVVPRESAGAAGDLGDRAPAGLAPDTPVRVRIEQVSSVEHALVLGVPERTADGARLTAGLGRPLVLTTLEPREAMRILAEGRTGAPRAAAALLAAGSVVSVVGVVWLAADAVL